MYHEYGSCFFTGDKKQTLMRRPKSRDAKKVIKGELRLESTRVGIVYSAFWSDKSQVNRFAGMGDCLEYLPFSVQFLQEFFVRGELAVGIFDFAQIDDIIGTVDKEVDLCTVGIDFIRFMAPGAGACENTANLQGVLDLGDMLQADSLKGKPFPSVMPWREEVG